jgi:hypothetical protein
MVGHFLKMQVSRHDPQPQVACIAWRVFEAARSDMWLSASGTGCFAVFAEGSSSTLSHITVPPGANSVRTKE